MRSILTVALWSLPAAAQAMCLPGGSPSQSSAGLLAGALYGALAALGYWVLQHCEKEPAVLVKRTGQAVAGALVVIGLLGLLCSACSHAKRAMIASCCCAMERGMREAPMSPPMGAAPASMGGQGMAQPMPGPAKTGASNGPSQ